MYDLSRMTLKDMTRCGAALRRLDSGAGSMEEVAIRIVRLFHEELGTGADGERACLLARFYKTHPYGELDPELQAFAAKVMDGAPLGPAVKCLSLLATAGDRPEWNSRHRSVGHRAIPLPSERALQRLPMVASLVKQLGVAPHLLFEPDPSLILDLQQRTFNVFHVPDALGSPFIPAQDDFVIPYGVRSSIGFGGVLPTGDLFAVILFTTIPCGRETADMFKPLALSTKMAVLPFSSGPVFAEGASAT